MRHAGVLSALLVTAALLCAMPGLARLPRQQGRADDSLRPARLRTLTVWLMPGDVGDRKLISRLCASFEKERPGTRVFLRVVTAEEWYAEGVVLPDAALFQTGSIAAPETLFVPLWDADHASGRHAGTPYAVPLWLAPNVLSIPQSWLSGGAAPAGQGKSLLGAATPQPPKTGAGVLSADDLPWDILTQPGAVAAPEGVACQQLLSACPAQLRARLVGGALGLTTQTPAPPEALVTTLPMGASLPTPIDLTTPARMETLASHRARLEKGEALAAHVPETAVSQRVRYAALCRDSEDARAFVRFFIEHRAMSIEHGLIPPGAQNLPGDALTQALVQSYQSAALPNAFAHTAQELAQLCLQGFSRCDNPHETLLRLR